MDINKEKLVTIFFPSRGRLELVEKLLNSIEEKTYNKDWIEVISICDQDDDETINFFQEKSKTLSYDFCYVVRPVKKPFNLSKDYHSLAIRTSSDAYFMWGIGNDCEFISDEWDLLFYNLLSNSSQQQSIFEQIENDEGYFYVTIADGGHWHSSGNVNPYGDKSCCFPMLSKNYCDRVKEYMPEQLSGWGADTWLYWLINHSTKFTNLQFNNYIGLNHYCYHNGTYEKDEVACNMEQSALDVKPEEDTNFDFTKYKFLDIQTLIDHYDENIQELEEQKLEMKTLRQHSQWLDKPALIKKDTK